GRFAEKSSLYIRFVDRPRASGQKMVPSPKPARESSRRKRHQSANSIFHPRERANGGVQSGGGGSSGAQAVECAGNRRDADGPNHQHFGFLTGLARRVGDKRWYDERTGRRPDGPQWQANDPDPGHTHYHH